MSTVRVVCILFGGLAGVLACTGGTGSLPPGWDGWDYQTGKWDDRERPQSGLDNVFPANGREVPPLSGDPAPNGGGALICPSFFQCSFSGPITICISGGKDGGTNCTTEQVKDFSFPIALEPQQDGACGAGSAVFEPGGSLVSVKDGASTVVARWFVNGDSLVLTNGQVTLVCNKTASLGSFTSSSGSADQQQTGSSSGATSSSGTTIRGDGGNNVIVIEAGAP